MSNRIPAAGNADDQRGSEPDMSATDEFAKMRAVMRASESTGKAGWIQNSRSRTQIPALTPEPGSGGFPLSPGAETLTGATCGPPARGADVPTARLCQRQTATIKAKSGTIGRLADVCPPGLRSAT